MTREAGNAGRPADTVGNVGKGTTARPQHADRHDLRAAGHAGDAEPVVGDGRHRAGHMRAVEGGQLRPAGVAWIVGVGVRAVAVVGGEGIRHEVVAEVVAHVGGQIRVRGHAGVRHGHQDVRVTRRDVPGLRQMDLRVMPLLRVVRVVRHGLRIGAVVRLGVAHALLGAHRLDRPDEFGALLGARLAKPPAGALQWRLSGHAQGGQHAARGHSIAQRQEGRCAVHPFLLHGKAQRRGAQAGAVLGCSTGRRRGVAVTDQQFARNKVVQRGQGGRVCRHGRAAGHEHVVAEAAIGHNDDVVDAALAHRDEFVLVHALRGRDRRVAVVGAEHPEIQVVPRAIVRVPVADDELQRLPRRERHAVGVELVGHAAEALVALAGRHRRSKAGDHRRIAHLLHLGRRVVGRGRKRGVVDVAIGEGVARGNQSTGDAPRRGTELARVDALGRGEEPHITVSVRTETGRAAVCLQPGSTAGDGERKGAPLVLHHVGCAVAGAESTTARTIGFLHKEVGVGDGGDAEEPGLGSRRVIGEPVDDGHGVVEHLDHPTFAIVAGIGPRPRQSGTQQATRCRSDGAVAARACKGGQTTELERIGREGLRSAVAGHTVAAIAELDGERSPRIVDAIGGIEAGAELRTARPVQGRDNDRTTLNRTDPLQPGLVARGVVGEPGYDYGAAIDVQQREPLVVLRGIRPRA